MKQAWAPIRRGAGESIARRLRRAPPLRAVPSLHGTLLRYQHQPRRAPHEPYVRLTLCGTVLLRGIDGEPVIGAARTWRDIWHLHELRSSCRRLSSSSTARDDASASTTRGRASFRPFTALYGLPTARRPLPPLCAPDHHDETLSFHPSRPCCAHKDIENRARRPASALHPPPPGLHRRRSNLPEPPRRRCCLSSPL